MHFPIFSGPLASMSDVSQRKTDHLDLTISGNVGFTRTNLLEQVELVHQALPELEYATIDTQLSLFGKSVRSPLVIASMTGGNERAESINHSLAEVAERGGYAIGLGSQRAMVKTGRIDASVARSYQLRHIAPHVPLFGNIGVMQAKEMSLDLLEEMVGCVGADALCVHLNPAQEMIQPEGDRDFRGGLQTIARLNEELSIPILVKETGCGISRETALQLQRAGVKHLDVSGAGGTSWVAVEKFRAQGELASRGELFHDWGIPTAASLLEVAPCQFSTVIATGGIRSGLDVARALALGAHAAGVARYVLQALDREGIDGALQFLQQIENELRTTMLLTGSANLAALRRTRRLLGPALQAWQQSSL